MGTDSAFHLNHCEHLDDLEFYIDFYGPSYGVQWEYNHEGVTHYLCEDCAAEKGYCVFCGRYTGEDMRVAEQEVIVERFTNSTVLSFGTFKMCDKCFGGGHE